MFFRKRKNDRALEEQIKQNKKRLRLDLEMLEGCGENRTLMFEAFTSGSTGPGKGCQSLEEARSSSYFRQRCMDNTNLKEVCYFDEKRY